MYLEGKRNGEAVAPLEQLSLIGAEDGTITVADGKGRVYVQAPATPSFQFIAGGVAGWQTITHTAPDGAVAAVLHFLLEAQTRIQDAGGTFDDLLTTLYYTMLHEYGDTGSVRWRGRIYQFFICWLRDHVHTMKGMKYFSPTLTGAIDLYRDSQREDGMIWDNVYPRVPSPNYWDMRFAEGDFIRPFEDDTAEFKRIPVEADVEYLFVEGLYYTWKAVGDDAWMAASLDAAIRAMEYSVTSPYRWSQKFGLIKRGYTIDTWDFQDAEDCVVAGDIMRVDPERTRFGIMFGDNTGYIAACRCLAEMLDRVGRGDEAKRYRARAAEMQERLDRISWTGRYYRHHVPEEEGLTRDLGVDEASQVSLSNAYSLNRGIAHEQCAAIVNTYRQLAQALPPGSPGEWYTIYPPFLKGFGDALWQYMNGAVTPIVAGELAHGAFEHGFEEYGVDILHRVAALPRPGGVIHCMYTGAFPPPPETAYTPLDLASLANTDTAGTGAPAVPGWTGEGANDLHEMPSGRQTLAGIPFEIPDPAANGRRACIGLSTRAGYARRADLAVRKTAAAVYLLHTTAQTGPGGVGGTITLRYADGSTYTRYIVRDVNASSWWFPQAPAPQSGRKIAEVAWRGRNDVCLDVGVLAYGLDNPYPDREIERITLQAADDGAFWAIFGVTLSDRPVYFPPDPVSYGAPHGWGAAAVVYALVEGLAGVVDGGVAYDRAVLAPRWPAAGVDDAGVTVTYPASRGYASYRYRHDPARCLIELEVTGSGERCDCHVLLPRGVTSVLSLQTADGPLDYRVYRIEHSSYADFTLLLPGPQLAALTYAPAR